MEHIGSVLRKLRQSAGLTETALADRVHISVSYLSHIEHGRRPLPAKLAASCDQVLGTAPLLYTLTRIGEDMQRRTALKAAAVAATVGAAGGLATVLSSGLLDEAMATTDWDATVGDLSRRSVVAPTRGFGVELETTLTVLKVQTAQQPTTGRLRAGAQLTQLWALYEGNMGATATAGQEHQKAAMIADRVGDDRLRGQIRARWGSRGGYEGLDAHTVLDLSRQGLAFGGDGAALEAWAAQIHVYAILGDSSAGTAAVDSMQRVADRLGTREAAQRAASFASYFACRTGTPGQAAAAYAKARELLVSTPVWAVDAAIYYGLALVRGGDVGGGAAAALNACQGMEFDVKVLGWGVADLLRFVPEQAKHLPQVVELSRYAATGPGPWVTLAA